MMSSCKLEQVGTKECGKMLKRIEGGCGLSSKREDSCHGAERAMECCQRENVGRDRGALPKEEGDQLREYKAMHEENKS